MNSNAVDEQADNKIDESHDHTVSSVKRERSPNRDHETHQRSLAIRENLRLSIEILALVTIMAGTVIALMTLQSIKQSVVEAGRSAGAAEQAAISATRQIPIQRDQMEIARRQMELAVQQVADARASLRLEQRAWLGYDSYRLEARPRGASAAWDTREIGTEDEFRIRLFVTNTGNTPAINATFKSSTSVVRRGQIPDEPQWDTIPMTRAGTVFFPRDPGSAQTTDPLMIARDPYVQYSTGSHYLFVWARLQYCDTNGRSHWSKVAVFHLFNTPPTEFHVWAGDVSSDLGDPDHLDCQTQ